MGTLDQYSSSGPKANKYDAEKTTETIEIQEGVVVEDGLRRALLGRHVSLISLASVIGASCFYGFGAALNDSGPLGALIGFAVVGASHISTNHLTYYIDDAGPFETKRILLLLLFCRDFPG